MWSEDKVWCKDCIMNPLPIRWRPSPYPGPRCATHHRQATLRTARGQSKEKEDVA